MYSEQSNDAPADRAGQLLSTVYPQLRRLAASSMKLQMHDQTIQPTALVHEAWIRLSAHQTRSWWDNPTRLFGAASTTMRRILIDRARQRAEAKHGGSWVRVPMFAAETVPTGGDEKLLAIHESLLRLEQQSPLYAQVVVMRVFGGLSVGEIARELEITERTVHRYWIRAKAWLYSDIVNSR